jgi:hypothetical protein
LGSIGHYYERENNIQRIKGEKDESKKRGGLCMHRWCTIASPEKKNAYTMEGHDEAAQRIDKADS